MRLKTQQTFLEKKNLCVILQALLYTKLTPLLFTYHRHCLQVHNDPNCASAPYSCQRSVSLFLPFVGEVRLHATNVTFKGQRSAEHLDTSILITSPRVCQLTSLRPGFSLQLPHHIHELRLERISHYVLATQQLGFTLAWDGGSGSVYIKLSPEFVGRTCGLCGNFNADVRDDLKTSFGIKK